MSPKDDERVEVRVPADDLKRWRVTASAEGLGLSEWIRRRCNEGAVDQEMIDLVNQKLAEERERAKRAAAELAPKLAPAKPGERRAPKKGRS